jgi:hypothetical protein
MSVGPLARRFRSSTFAIAVVLASAFVTVGAVQAAEEMKYRGRPARSS